MRAPMVACAFLFLASLLGAACDGDAPAADADPLAGVTDPQTLSQLLQWSLKHHDLDALHKKAEAVRSGEALPTPPAEGAAAAVDEILKPLTPERREELNALSQQLMPNQAELMRLALDRAMNSSLAEDEREGGMLDLQELVEDIDNARDLKNMARYADVIALLGSDVAALQAAAAWTIGSAVKSTHELQLHLLAEGALPSLLGLARTHADHQVRAKALYATAALLRNCPEAQEAFLAADGVSAVLSGLDAPPLRPKLVRKVLALVTDLLRERRQDGDFVLSEPFAPAAGALCSAVVDCFAMDELDAQEKALLALEQLVAYGLVQPGTCALDRVRAVPRGYRERCERALRAQGGSEDEDAAEGVGACDELLPLAFFLTEELDALARRYEHDEV